MSKKIVLILLTLLSDIFISPAQVKQRFDPHSLQMEWRLLKDQTNLAARYR